MTTDRRFERQQAAYHAEVRRRDTGAIVGHLADLSLGGAMLTAEAPLPVGERLELAIELPRGGRLGEHVHVAATVRWCEPDLVPGLYAIGLAFDSGGDAPHLLRRVLADSR